MHARRRALAFSLHFGRARQELCHLGALTPARSVSMSSHLYRLWAMSLVLIALVACTNSGTLVVDQGIADQGTAPPLGVDLGGSGPVATAAPAEGHAPTPQHRSDMQMAHAGRNDAHGTGTVNSVDPAQHKINLSHQPISELGWPAMTMDFPVAATVDLKPLKPGTRVNFTIEQPSGGMYEIQAITPAGGSR
jgi:Cu(I)/Ag(I) efflux system periplasmic protein CusF